MKNKVIFKWVSLVICLLMVISILIVGCGQGKSTSSVPTPVEGPQKGGILKIGIDRDPSTIGYPATAMFNIDPMFSRPAVEGLVRLDKTGIPVPWLATSWETDPNSKTITFKLRKGVKFHDGTDFNAQAVKWNLEQFVTAKKLETLQVKSIDVVDDYTVRLNLSELDNLLVINFGSYPGMIVSPTAVQKNGVKWAETNPVGTGPFKFVSWERGNKVVYQKFDGYWQPGQPLLDGIEFDIIVDRMTQTASLERGEIDLIADLDPKSAKDLQTSGKYNITLSSIPAVIPQLLPDSLSPSSPISNLKVRQALWYAIDLPAITKALFYGFAEPLNQGASSKSWAYNPEVKGYPYNPEKSKQLLAEAGYPNGFSTTLDFLTPLPYPDIATAIQGYLSKVGITAKIQLRENNGHVQHLLSSGWKNNLFLVPTTVVGNEFSNHARFFIPGAHEIKTPLLFVPKEVEDLVSKALKEPNTDTMKKLVQQAMKVETDDFAMSLFLYSVPGLAAKNKQVNDDGIFDTFQPQWTPEKAWKNSDKK